MRRFLIFNEYYFLLIHTYIQHVKFLFTLYLGEFDAVLLNTRTINFTELDNKIHYSTYFNKMI